jgi:hypothetical protein
MYQYAPQGVGAYGFTDCQQAFAEGKVAMWYDDSAISARLYNPTLYPLFQIMTGGGPGLKTTVLNFYVYQNTFQFWKLGYGAALAVILVIMMAIPLVSLFRFARSTD